MAVLLFTSSALPQVFYFPGLGNGLLIPSTGTPKRMHSSLGFLPPNEFEQMWTDGDQNWKTHFRGVSPEYIDIKRWQMAEGAFLTDDNVRRTESVVVIGETVRQQLFPSTDPVGQVVRVNNRFLFQVIGVLAPKGQSGSGQDQDDTIVIPWTTAQKKIRGKNNVSLDDIYLSAVSMEEANPASDAVTVLLRQRHHLRLSLLGGLLGIPLSMVGSFLIAQLLGWPLTLSPQAAMLAVTCSGFVGIVSGFYPAWRASRLDPIAALRNG